MFERLRKWFSGPKTGKHARMRIDIVIKDTTRRHLKFSYVVLYTCAGIVFPTVVISHLAFDNPTPPEAALCGLMAGITPVFMYLGLCYRKLLKNFDKKYGEGF